MLNLGLFKPQVYDQTNQLQIADGRRLLGRLADQFDRREVDTVVDIGCGTGNVTVLLHEYLECSQIIGFDCKPEMIDYARSHHSRSNVRYEVGNILKDYETLSSQVDVDQNVDLVISNQCLQWVTQKNEIVMKNMYKMLKPGGEVYVNFCIWLELLPVLESVARHPKWLRYFPKLVNLEYLHPDAQCSPVSKHLLFDWNQSAIKAGFVDFKMETFWTSFEYENIDHFLDAFQNIFTYFKEVPNEELWNFQQDAKRVIHDMTNVHQKCYPNFMFNYENVFMHMKKPLE